MGPVAVVVVQPAREGGQAGLVAGIQLGIGPLGGQGAVEPLSLAVGLGPIGPGPPMSGAGLRQHPLERRRAIAPAVVGQHPLHLDAQPGEPGQRSAVKSAAVWPCWSARAST